MNPLRVPPRKPLVGAKVWVRLVKGGKLLPGPNDPVRTNADGKFHVKAVPNGVCELIVDVQPYPVYYSEKIAVKDSDEKADVCLMPLTATAEQYGNVAVTLVNLAPPEDGGMREDYYAKEWKGWVNMNLPPSSRTHLAFALNQKDKSAAAGQADLKTYTKETPENVRTVEALFGQALAGKKDLPSKTSLGELKVGNEVIADVMLYQLRDSSLSEEMRSALAKEFLKKWEGTVAATRFAAYQRQGLDNAPLTLALKDRRPHTVWKYDDLAAAVKPMKSGRSFANGKAMFKVANCTACHKMNDEGNDFGPDLAMLDPKVKSLDILKSVVDPSVSVNEKYQQWVIETKAGKTVTGMIMEETPKKLTIRNPLINQQPIVLSKFDIESKTKSTKSVMPNGLLDDLTRDEILDLIAYITARGKRQDPLFRADERRRQP